jgi:hypothetical protein
MENPEEMEDIEQVNIMKGQKQGPVHLCLP